MYGLFHRFYRANLNSLDPPDAFEGYIRFGYYALLNQISRLHLLHRSFRQPTPDGLLLHEYRVGVSRFILKLDATAMIVQGHMPVLQALSSYNVNIRVMVMKLHHDLFSSTAISRTTLLQSVPLPFWGIPKLVSKQAPGFQQA